MSEKVQDLYQAFHGNSLPKEGGYIVSSFFDQTTSYSRYEIVSYSGVKNIFMAEEGLTFQSDGKKLYVLVEPPGYPKKHIEPIHRDKTEAIPHRYSELLVFTAKDQTKVMVSENPIMSYSSFTILKPTTVNFALVFYDRPDVVETMEFFFQKTLNREAGVSQVNSAAAAKTISGNLHKLSFTF